MKLQPLYAVFAFLAFSLLNTHSYTQELAIVAYNGSTGDGYTIVAAAPIPGNTKFYFTDSEYISGAMAFASGEGVWSYTTPGGGLSTGDVITFTETGTSTNVLALACSFGGSCGSFLNDSGNSISLASGTPEGLYAYKDTDGDHTNGVTEVIAAFYFRDGNIPIGEDPRSDYPSAIVVDGFTTTFDHKDFKDALRSGLVTRADIENITNYDAASGNQVLSIVGFANITLPVELVDFDVRMMDDWVRLEWSTAWELNHAYFAIERSLDGLHFSTIGKEDGRGDTQQMSYYYFEDTSPLQGRNYYRLRQVDQDGSYSYSKIKSVENRAFDLSVFPNPFSQSVSISIPESHKGLPNFSIVILDVYGKEVVRKELGDKERSITLDLTALPSATYFLSVKFGNETQGYRRIIKM